MVVNKRDINESLLLIPNPLYNVFLLNILKIKTDLYENVKEVKEIQEKIKDYLGVRFTPEGTLEAKPELDKDACVYVKQLIEVYNLI